MSFTSRNADTYTKNHEISIQQSKGQKGERFTITSESQVAD
jgi:hypothetical protein